MRLSRLKRLIEEIPPIPGPRLDLEQYTTPAELVVQIISHLENTTGVQGHRVGDLAAGTCRLGLPLLLLGAELLAAVEADPRLAPYCIEAASRLGVDDRLVYIVSRVEHPRGPLRPCSLDIIVSNPPFGVHRRGADWSVLGHALEASSWRVYAILKSGNIDYHRRAAESMGYSARLLGSSPFPIPASMVHHRSRVRRVMVDVVLFEREAGCPRGAAGGG